MTAGGRQPHILIIDDTQEILDLLGELLETRTAGAVYGQMRRAGLESHQGARRAWPGTSREADGAVLNE
jgi:hypothetical protein